MVRKVFIGKERQTRDETPTATRPLAIRKDGTWYAYGWDLTKNICEVFKTNGTLGTAYTYTPHGQVTAEGSVTQPIQWSSEYHDAETALVYYNYRHYNPTEGRWLGRDRIGERGGMNLYRYVANNTIALLDSLGLDYTVKVDEEKCTITFSLVIVLDFDDTVPEKDRASIRRHIENTIEQEWSGKKKDCCTVNVEVELRESSIWNYIEDWFTPKGRENNYMKVTYNQGLGHNETKRSYVIGGQKGVFVTNATEVNSSPNPRTGYATWAYAHEAGHLMGLEDGYYEANGRQGVKAGYNGDEMMTAAHAQVTQGDINRLTANTACKCNKKKKE